MSGGSRSANAICQSVGIVVTIGRYRSILSLQGCSAAEGRLRLTLTCHLSARLKRLYNTWSFASSLQEDIEILKRK